MPTAMVWGASGGIGSALVDELVKRNWNVIAISRSDLVSEQPGVTHITADPGSAFSVRSAVLQAGQMIDTVDLWIYAAGVIRPAPVSATDDIDWDSVIQVNLTGAYLASKHSLPLLSPSAKMIYLGAISDRLRLPGFASYAAAKAGLEAFVATLAKEERTKSILLVRPGAVATPFWKNLPIKLPKTALHPSEVARRILDAVESGQTGVLDIV